MEKKSSSKSANDQRNSQALDQMREHMGKAGFVAGSQIPYLRELERFAAKLDRKGLDEATVADARRYLTRLKQAAPSATLFSHASASLRFYFEDVRGLAWKPLSPLRLRMIEDMQLCGFSTRTQQSYVRSVEGLARYHGKSPEVLDNEQIRKYFVHLTCERKLARPTVTIALCGIKFLYEKTLKRDWSLTGVPVPKRKKSLPVVLSRKEVRDILSRVREVRHRACLSLIYACGLRLGEACRMEVGYIDRQRALVHVNGGKGFKDRYVPLPATILPLLEECWRSHRNPKWLFPCVERGGRRGQFNDRSVPLGTIQQVFRAALSESGVTKKVSVHSLRHAYATHLLEAHVDLRQIQAWLGHSSPSTTVIYAKVKPSVWKQHAWVVHSEPVGSGETTLGYLARYVNRVAISNKAILSATDTCITLRYRQSGTNKPRTLRLEPMEFIRRFLQHVLPSGFRKVRYFGLHHSSKRPTLRLIQAAMAALQANRPMPAPPPETEPYRPACPACQAPMEFERRVQGAKPAYGRGIRQQRGPP